MNALNALAKLRRLGTPIVETADAAATLRQTTAAASQTLKRLAGAGLITPVRHGAWWLDGVIEPLRLATYLTAPFDAYISLQTALHLHGLIEQIPEVTYAATLARTQRIITTAGTFSFHHLAPEVFGGFEEASRDVKLATAEKALFDVAYLSAGRSRLFVALPELELPKSFRRRELGRWLERIPSARARTLTSRRLDSFLAGAARNDRR